MPNDAYSKHRSLSFLAVASALGWDVSKFKTRKGGQEFYGPCALHGSKSNQGCFSYNVDGKYRCFSCPAKGSGAIDLTIAARSLGFQEAIQWLEMNVSTQTAQTTPEGKTAGSAVSLASQGAVAGESGELKPYTGKYSAYFVPNDWLAKRIPSPEVLDRYGVGFYQNPKRKSAYSGRVLIPFKDFDGRLWGYTGRLPEPKEGEAKYLVPSGFPKSRFIFGLRELVHERKFVNGAWVPFFSDRKKVYLVESAFTVLKFASLGLPALSLYGWSVSDEQLAELKDLGRAIVYLPDANKRREAESQAAKLATIGWVKFPQLPEGVTDPEHLSEEQIKAL